ncbi:caspase family protein [Tichowtungia aerotolerans]|uniref:Peptidase C14 caspase domain-containing protein n=1 Tax=Tichowtungia aerotolerans TaxID=2697043 RepID=A0A6P1M386_9BACT|nr:caspase family protein [Tichowtungia aerotolerans]QHI69070.1 hypothetical protein GT409_06295 [Tichowtungia aerotolerans]
MKTQCQLILLGVVLAAVTACERPQPGVLEKPPDTTPPALTYHALVIGIGDYNGTGWLQLGTARADAEEIGDVLHERYGFHVTKLTDHQATRGNILRALDQLMQLTSNDALLIYFAGHGSYDESMGEGYWIPFGAERSRMGLPAKEDWLWNSSISRILQASPARHILLVADTCYGGALFRGEETPEKSDHWYRRAMDVPSRYLITSGNLEPVLDSGIRHSVFAQELLNYLRYAEQEFFSASDIAVAIRSKVSRLTGQLVRMGPLPSPAHAGGEFVFVRSGSILAQNTEPVPDPAVFRNAEPIGTLQSLADRIESASFMRPRVLACLGPSGDNAEETAVVRSRLQDALRSIGGTVLVEREAFDDLLQEVELGKSGMADRRAAMEIGRLLPASLILFGEMVPFDGQTEIQLRVVDTETSRVLSAVNEPFTDRSDLDSACRTLAEQIMQAVDRARPVIMPARPTDDGNLTAGWGRFHGAQVGDTFAIITRTGIGTIAPKETVCGTAKILSLGEEEALFAADWSRADTNRPATQLWLKATF